MARADLIIDLVKYGLAGDKARIKKIAEAIVAEERQKNHSVLANRIECEVNSSANNRTIEQSKFTPINQLAERHPETFITEIMPRKTFADMILPNGVKMCCDSLISENHRVELLHSYGLEPRNRILLIGAPGTGKTSLAEAIANELMVPMFVVKYDSIIGPYLGETASRLRRLIDYVSTRRCVLFFDEFETIGKERGDKHETGEIKRVVSSLLLQMDSIPSYVTVIAATNHPELLDKAAWRRFQIRMELPMPSRASISSWLALFEKQHQIRLGYAHETIAKKMLGANFSEIEEFAMTVLRKHVLNLPDSDIKSIVDQELKSWKVSNAKLNENGERAE